MHAQSHSSPCTIFKTLLYIKRAVCTRANFCLAPLASVLLNSRLTSIFSVQDLAHCYASAVCPYAYTYMLYKHTYVYTVS